MQIFVKTENKTSCLEVEMNMSLEELKEVVSGLTGLDASELTLSH